MLVRYGLEDSTIVSRFILLNDLQKYYSAGNYLTSPDSLGQGRYVIPRGKLLVLVGGRKGLQTDYFSMGPGNLMCEWSTTDTSVPNVQVIRQKQVFGHNFTALLFGALKVPTENKKNPVYDLRRPAPEGSRQDIYGVLQTILKA